MSFEPSAAQSPTRAVEHPRTEVVRLHVRNPAINVAGRERGASVLGGVSLLGIGLLRRGWTGAALGAAGVALTLRGTTGRCAVYRSLGVSTARGNGIERDFDLARATTVAAPLDLVRSFFLDPAELSRVAGFLESVQALAGDRWQIAAHWPRRGRAIEWDLDVVQEQNHIEWRSGDNAPFEHVLRIELAPAPADRGTEVIATLCVTPPGGVAGLAVGRWLEGVLEGALGAALAKAKQRIETGEVASLGNAPAGRRGAVRRRIGRWLPTVEEGGR